MVILLGLAGSGATALAQAEWKGLQSLESWEGSWQVEADSLRAEGEAILLEGEVRARGPAVEIRADRMEIDSAAGKVVLSGAVKLFEGRAEVSADSLELDRVRSRAVLSRSRIVLRRAWPATRPAGPGHNELQIESGRLVYGEGRYFLEGSSFTTCDCGNDAPSWRICARRASVEPGEGAWLEWPVLRIKEVPVLVLPLAYLPLSERRSGLLFPQLNFSGRDGFVVSEALFVTLGRSADTTLTVDWFEERGFRERLELRARPTASSGFAVTGSLMLRDTKLAARQETEELARRWAVEGSGWVDWPAAGLRATARLYSDSDFFRDFASEMAGRAQELAASAVLFESRGTDLLFEADAAFRQDLRFGRQDLFAEGASAVPGPPDTEHRLGGFALYLAPLAPRWLPLEVSGALELANLSSLSAAWRDFGPDGLPDPSEPRYAGAPAADRSGDNGAGGEGDGTYDTGELRRALRILFEPRLELRKTWAPLGVEFSVWHRQLAYLPHGPEAPEPSTRGLSFAAAAAWTELARSWGDLGHRLRPRVELAAAWRGLESSKKLPYLDLQDRLLGDAGQLLLGLDNFFATRSEQGAWSGLLDLSLQQGLDLRAARVGQAAAELRLRRRAWGASAFFGWDWRSGGVAEIRGGAYLRAFERLRLSADYLYLPSVADAEGRPVPLSERLHREPGLPQGAWFSWLHGLGGTVQSLLAQGSIYFGGGLNLQADGMADLHQRALGWVGGGVDYRSPCRCWGLLLTTRYLRGQDYPDVFFILEVAGVTTASGGTTTRF